MATNTYVSLDKKTVSSAVTSVTFTNIDQTYTDLILVVSGTTDNGGTQGVTIQFNSDTSSAYSRIVFYGNASSGATYTTDSNSTTSAVGLLDDSQGNSIIRIKSYTSTTKYKTIIARGNSAAQQVRLSAGLWRGTSAVTSMTIGLQGNTIAAGTTFSLYGIKAEAAGSTPKATGGLVTSDATYYYHTFANSSNFVPNQTLSCDYLIVAGGGGGGAAYAAGGGAGGYRSFTSSSITAGTYPVVIGAGGSGGIYGGVTGSIRQAPTSGSVSTFNGYSSAGGGSAGYVADGAFYGVGGDGGSGGGGSRDRAAGSGNTPSTSPSQGNNGGTGTQAPYYNGGGGGGAGAAGGNSGSNGGVGGAGLNWLSLGTYYAGGGGGGAGDTGGFGAGGIGGGGTGGYGYGGNGSYATGGGGGGAVNGGAGGGGIVIVRYAK